MTHDAYEQYATSHNTLRDDITRIAFNVRVTRDQLYRIVSMIRNTRKHDDAFKQSLFDAIDAHKQRVLKIDRDALYAHNVQFRTFRDAIDDALIIVSTNDYVS